MKKKAAIKSVLPQIYEKIRTMPQFSGKLPPYATGVIEEMSVPSENPQAVAYVTNVDANKDGKIDKIHIVMPRLEEEARRLNLNPDINDRRTIGSILHLLAHEVLGHIQDYAPHNEQNPFPGGEPIAEQKAEQTLSQFSAQATNIQDRFDKLSTISGETMRSLEALIKLSNVLDQKGHYKLADEVDTIVKKIAAGFPMHQPVTEIGTAPENYRPEMTGARKRYEENKNATPGAIQPPGDPYTYDYLRNKDVFVVRTTPAGKEYSIGARLGSGTEAYKKLEPYVRGGEQVAAPPVAESSEYETKLRKLLERLLDGLDKNRWGYKVTDLFKHNDTLNKLYAVGGKDNVLWDPHILSKYWGIIDEASQDMGYTINNKDELKKILDEASLLGEKLSQARLQARSKSRAASDKKEEMKKNASLDLKTSMDIAFAMPKSTPFGR